MSNESDKKSLDYEVTNNTEDKRFEIHTDGEMAFEDYEFFTTSEGKKGIEYKHTLVPEAIGGRGIAGYLVKYILDYAENENLVVKPTCPYVKSYIDKHPEYQDNSVFHNAKS